LPLYEYRCKSCGYSFEKIQNFSAEPETVCPKCAGELFRPMTAPALQFKGAGWYINDYSSKGKAGAGESGGSANSGAETKPAESTAPKSSEPAAPAPAPSSATSAAPAASTPAAS